MTRLHRPKGLVRYDSLRGLEGKKTQWIRPRIILYTVLLAAGVTALIFSLGKLRPYQSSITRLRNMPYFVNEMSVRNQFQVRLTNKQPSPMKFSYRLEGAPEGTTLNIPNADQPVDAEKELVNMALVEMPLHVYHGSQPMKLVIVSEPDKVETKLDFEFSGPDPRTLKESRK